jgi:hypothetical protein
MIQHGDAARLLRVYLTVSAGLTSIPSSLVAPGKSFRRRHDRAVIFKVDTERQMARTVRSMGRPFTIANFRDQLEKEADL